MTCRYCEQKLVQVDSPHQYGEGEWYKHATADGLCPGYLTIQEKMALKRVAQAQIEMDERRGSR